MLERSCKELNLASKSAYADHHPKIILMNSRCGSYNGVLCGGVILYKYDHVFTSRVTSGKKVFFIIRLKSKENFSAISARKKIQIDEELVVFVQ
jgi:hypothetical protein